MECRICSESVTAFIDEELPSEQRRRIEAHLAVCRDCRTEFESLIYASNLVDQLGPGPLSAPDWNLVEAKIRPSDFWQLHWLWKPAWAAATAVLLLAISLPFYWSSTGEDAHVERMLARYVQERDAVETVHEGIIATHPVGLVSYNPFTVDASLSRNSF